MTNKPQSDFGDILKAFQKLHPKEIDLSLDRLERCLAAMGNPHKQLPPVIHIAGTNGKGSTGAILSALLTASGKSVHKYISPHLVSFNERISLTDPNSGKPTPISDQALIDLFAQTQKANNGEQITTFEIITAAAFLAFSQAPADYVILETGLGGRLDATNIVDKKTSAILTPISLDHKDYLGDTLTKIAREKAAIINQATKVISARQKPEALKEIMSAAQSHKIKPLVMGEDADCFVQNGRLIYTDDTSLFDLPLPQHLKGTYQIENAGVAIAAARALLPDEMTDDVIAKGLKQAKWPARFQQLNTKDFPALLPDDELWLDGGHNPHAARQLAFHLSEMDEKAPRPIHLIMGMLSNKDAEKFLECFRGLAFKLFAIPIPSHENCYPPKSLVKKAHALDIRAETASDLNAALQASTVGRKEPARILICGSLYLAGDVLKDLDISYRAYS